jgi:hypothetical protein
VTDKGKLALDSGTEMAILFEPSATGRAQPRDLRFRVAGRQFMTLAASVPGVSPHEDGLLPASLFHAIYASKSGRYVVAPGAKQSL